MSDNPAWEVNLFYILKFGLTCKWIYLGAPPPLKKKKNQNKKTKKKPPQFV